MLNRLALPLLLGLLTACNAEWSAVDADGDGVPFGQDCDDLNGDVGDKVEIWYDGIDQDCDGNDADMDGDGFVPSWYVADFPDTWQDFPAHIASGDCWDSTLEIPEDQVAVGGAAQPSAELVYPGAGDAWYDGVDQDCEENSDFDQDGDGQDSQWHENVAGEVGTDCADAVEDLEDVQDDDCGVPSGIQPEDIFLGAPDAPYDGVNQDCGVDDFGAFENDFDADGDGFVVCEECDDSDANIFPNEGIEELWYNGIDENCDGNDGDRDGDGYVDAAYIAAFPSTWDAPEFTAHRTVVYDSLGVEVEGLPAVDCWDDPTVTPAEFQPLGGLPPLDPDEVYPRAKADEPADAVYDGIDADCWQDSDFDFDQDGHDAGDVSQRGGALGDDCDDGDPSVFPGVDLSGVEAVESCDEVDSNCDGSINDVESLGCEAYYIDADGDSFGVSGGFVCQCEAEGSYTSLLNTDCNDGDKHEYPGAPDLCDGQDNDCDGSLESDEQDDDGDGYVQCTWPASGWDTDSASMSGGEDCDDTDNTIYPNATELCDGQDNDCDGSLASVESDLDSDGYVACSIDGGGWDGSSTPTGYDDCDDAESTTNPGAAEQVADGVDNDCDSVETCYADVDGDGFGDPSATAETGSSNFNCDRDFKGLADDSDDCDDTDETVYLGADELCDGQDNACAGSIDTDEIDNDSDGYVECSDDGSTWAASSITGYDDCDDSASTVYPTAAETVADGVDQDCDDVDTCYRDADEDGYGSTTEVDGIDLDCDQASSKLADDATDCDDTDDVVYPTATELCDGQDNACLGSTPTNETDDDSDDYVECSDDGSDWAGPSGLGYDDCDDTDPDINPGEREICDSANTDEDCNGSADDLDSGTKSSSKTTWYVDADSDTYGDDQDSGTALCEQPSGYVSDNTDCDDSNSGVSPGESSDAVGDEVDQDCDGTELCYVDSDEDGFGSTSTVASTADALCSTADNESTLNTDCDDGDILINPDGTEVCDADDDDEDCNGSADDSDAGVDVSTMTTFYVDADTDTFGDENDAGTDYCDAPSGYVTDNTDCLDSDADVNTDATEVRGDAVDDDCDGTADPYLLSDLSAGDLIITEIMINPAAVLDSLGEYIEVFNNSGGEVDVEGLYFTNDSSRAAEVTSGVVVTSSVVADGDYFLIGASSDSVTNGGYSPDATYTWGAGASSFSVGNSGEIIGMYSDSGETLLLDEVDFTDSTYFGTPVATSMSLDDIYLDADANDHGGHWCESTTALSGGDDGTPGAANDACGFAYSFAIDIEPVLTTTCGGCHGGAGGSGNLSYIEEWDSLVYVASDDLPSMYLIDPFDSTTSYLQHKIDGTQLSVSGAGDQMPKGGGSLTAGEITMIEDWINEGAPQ